MTKRIITRVWLIGFAVFIVGLIIGGVSLGLMFAYGGTYVHSMYGNGYDFVPTLDAYFWTMLGLAITGFIAALAGGVAQLVAWVGALINTNQLQDKTWFAVLLAGGLLGLALPLIGLATMVAYLIAGPDGTARQEPHYMAPQQWQQPMAPTG